MAKSMNAQSRKSSPEICGASRNVISSPASGSGVTPCASLAGPMTDLFGQAVAPAPVSQRPDKGKALMTLVTSGLLGRDSSASASLQRCLENRLMTRLATGGSTLFKLTWRGKTTPLGRRYLEHAVSVPRRSAQDCTSWPRPQVHDDKLRGNTEAENHSFPHDLSNAANLASWPRPSANEYDQELNETREKRRLEMKAKHQNGNGFGMTLSVSARLAAWPRPMAGSPATETYNEAGNTDSSRKTVELVGWTRPTVDDANNGTRASGQFKSLTRDATLTSWARPRGEDAECAGAHRGVADGLHSQAQLATWVRPSARDWKDTAGMETTGTNPDGSTRERVDQLPRQAQLAASGPTPNGSTARTGGIGQLNPRHSGWLMGLP